MHIVCHCVTVSLCYWAIWKRLLLVVRTIYFSDHVTVQKTLDIGNREMSDKLRNG